MKVEVDYIIDCQKRLAVLNERERKLWDCLVIYKRQGIFRRGSKKLELRTATIDLYQESSSISQALEHLNPDCFNCDLKEWKEVFDQKIETCDNLITQCENALGISITQLMQEYRNTL